MIIRPSYRWMRRIGLALAVLSFFGFTLAQNGFAAPPADQHKSSAEEQALQRFVQAPVPFEPNLGQTDAAAKFIARGLRYTVFFTQKSVLLRLADPQGAGKESVLEMKMVGARDARIQGQDALPSRSHYFHGNSADAWRSDVPNFAKVGYTGIYRDTDMVFYGRQGELEYDVILGPGAKPDSVVLEFSGARQLRIDESGDLVLGLSDGREIVQRRPKLYQQSGSERREIAGGYRLMAANRVRFEVGGYDRGKPLVIDPVLSYASYLGGSGAGNDYGQAIALDSTGNAYIAGYTNSVGFPTGTSAPIQASRAGGNDAFVAKLSADGGTLLYSTYLGGTSDDYAYSIAVDAAGNAYVTGYTNSSNFPATPGSFQPSPQSPGSNAPFVAKLDPTGSKLLYATYLGSGQGYGIAVDGSGNAYVTGQAYCCSFPTTAGAYKTTGSYTAFLTKVNPTGSGLVYSTLVGGNNSQTDGRAIALDAAGNAYLTGYTYASDFPTTAGAFQTAVGSTPDAFVTKVNASGSALVYSTLLGGNSSDYGYGIAVDSTGFAYVTGYTYSSNFPTTAGAYQTTSSGYHPAFVSKVNQTGTGLVYSTYLGNYYATGYGIALDAAGDAYIALQADSAPVTSGAVSYCCGSYVTKLNPAGTALVYSAQLNSYNASGIAVDNSGNAYFAGASSNSNYPVTGGAYQPSLAGATDAVVTKLNPSGTALVYSTFLGGGGGDQGNGVAVDASGSAYITGQAGSLDFPTLEAAKSTEGPYTDVFVAKFNAAGTALVYSSFLGGTGYDVGHAIAVDASGAAYVTGETRSTDFPVTAGAAQVVKPGGIGATSAFLMKLSPAGKLSYSTFIGGTCYQTAYGVAVDSAGNAYVGGNTCSSDILPWNRIGNANISSAFVVKVNPAGSAFIYATLVGGNSSTNVRGLALDSAGSAYLTGYTNASNFPVTNGAYQTIPGSLPDAFVLKLNPAGTALVYGTYLGGDSSDIAYGIAVDPAGSAYVTGYTYSQNFPVTTGALQSVLAGGTDAFVTKLNPAGSALVYSTYLGGSDYDYGYGIAVDPSGSAYVTGNTSSLNLPTTTGAIQPVKMLYTNNCNGCSSYFYYNNTAAFVTKLDPSGNTLQYSTYLGGTNYDYAQAIAVNPGYAVVAGYTYSSDLIGASLGFQPALPQGAQDAFIAKLSDPPAGCSYTVNPTTFNFGTSGGTGTVNVTAAAGCPWIASQGWLANLQSTTGTVPYLTGTGTGSVNFTVPSDTSTSDSGHVGQFSVAGQAITLTGNGLCPIGISPSNATYAADGVNQASISIAASGCYWNMFTTAPWISASPISNNYTNGTSTATYKILPNPQAATRTGVIYIGPQAFTVTQAGTGPTVATMISPPPASTLSGPSATFCWTPVPGADSYWLDVGTSVGTGNLSGGATGSACLNVTTLPLDGSTVYVQLYTHLSGAWLIPVRYTYTAAALVTASLVAPVPVTVYPSAPASALSGSQATFSWTAAPTADQYWLDVGRTLGVGDIFGGATTATSIAVSNLPCDGSRLYVQLWSHIGGTWPPPRQYTYQACSAATAVITDPPIGSALPSGPVLFKWMPVANADQYWLDVGSSLGVGNLFGGATIAAYQRISGLPCDGRTLYVQLYTHTAGTWSAPNRYTFKACSELRAKLTSPANNSRFTGTSVAFTWSAGGAGTTGYWLDVGSTVGRGDYYAALLSSGTTSRTVTTTPTDGSTVYVRLWTQIAGTWQTPFDYTFTAYNDRARIVLPSTQVQIPSTSTTFCWNPASVAADYWLDVGTSQGVGNIFGGIVTGTCQTVNLPTGSQLIWVRIWTRIPQTTGTWIYSETEYLGPS